jgi:hypothetical protein
MADRNEVWKMTAIGVLVAAATALVTGLVVANRSGVHQEAKVAPAPPPRTAVDVAETTPAASPDTTAKTNPSEAPKRVTSTPPRSVTEACNRQAAAQIGEPRDRKDKIVEAGKDAGIGALGGAAVGALGGAVAGGGKGAGKGAVIGGLVGAGGGTLYGIWDNKKHDENFRAAYSSCMKTRGYAA